jgi:hypothetical protein
MKLEQPLHDIEDAESRLIALVLFVKTQRRIAKILKREATIKVAEELREGGVRQLSHNDAVHYHAGLLTAYSEVLDFLGVTE